MILNICDNPSILSVMRIINMVILIIKIVVPIILILVGMITLMKTIKVGDDDLLAKAKKQLINNALAAIMVFLVPTIVSVLVKVSFSNGEYKDCLNNASSEVIAQKYYDRVVESISKAESSSNYNDYYDAVNRLNEISDKETKSALKKRLDSVKATIDNKIKEENEKENEKENPSEGSSDSNNSGSSGTFVADSGKTSECNKNGKYQLCSPKKGIFGSFAYYDSAAPNDTSNRNSVEMDPAWRSQNLVRVSTTCTNGTTYNWTVHILAKSTWKQVQEKFCQITTTGIDGIKYSPSEIVVSGPLCIRYISNTKTLSNHSYGTAIDINPSESYVIDGKKYPTPYGRSLENYNNFINALGSENDKRNVNYILWKKVFEPLGFIWGGNWGRDGKGTKIDGMHFEIDWKKE